MQMLYQRSAAAARTTVVAVRSRLPGAAEILDVGGGHGRYGAELAEAGYAVTLFDRPVCVAIARERYGDRIQYRAGDFMVDALGGPYDAALLSNIVHGFGFEENRTLLQHLRPALKPGGLVLVRDMFLDDYRAHPTEAAFFNLTMLMYTREGRVYPRREFCRLLETCGYRTTAEVVYHDSGHALLIAARP
jgi:2-polyprenyl-3-methyl-5-hydroxy-6-metoxy-1,4-benzoquinol methylase